MNFNLKLEQLKEFIEAVEQLKEFIEGEIHSLEKEWEGYNPDKALIPDPHFRYYQGKLATYREILAEMERS